MQWLTGDYSAVIEYRIQKRVKEQFDAFMAGFSELIPQELINVFDERELEVRTSYQLLICWLTYPGTVAHWWHVRDRCVSVDGRAQPRN